MPHMREKPWVCSLCELTYTTKKQAAKCEALHHRLTELDDALRDIQDTMLELTGQSEAADSRVSLKGRCNHDGAGWYISANTSGGPGWDAASNPRMARKIREEGEE